MANKHYSSVIKDEIMYLVNKVPGEGRLVNIWKESCLEM